MRRCLQNQTTSAQRGGGQDSGKKHIVSWNRVDMGGDRISLSRFAERIVELLLLCEVQSEDGVQIVRTRWNSPRCIEHQLFLDHKLARRPIRDAEGRAAGPGTSP